MAESVDVDVASTSEHSIEIVLREDEEIMRTESQEIDYEREVRITCKVEGEVHEDHDLSFLKDGQPIHESSYETLSTDLSIPSFGLREMGTYECNVRRPDGKFQKRKLRLRIKSKPIDFSEFNEEECEGLFRTAYCLNGGQCARHIESKNPSCYCPIGYRGTRCEYMTDDRVIILPGKQPTYDHSESYAVAAVGIFFLIALFTGLAAFGYFRYKKKAARRKPRDMEEFLHDSFSKESCDFERLSNPSSQRVVHDNFPEPETAQLMPQPKTPPTSPRSPIQFYGNQNSPTLQQMQHKAREMFLPEKLRRNDSVISYTSIKHILQRQKSFPARIEIEKNDEVKNFFLNQPRSAGYSKTY